VTLSRTRRTDIRSRSGPIKAPSFQITTNSARGSNVKTILEPNGSTFYGRGEDKMR
jgi:hypothetical protein